MTELPPSSESASPLDYASALLRRWKLLLALPVVTAAVAVVASFALTKQWTAKVAFAPVSASTGGVGSALTSLAGQFGVSVPGEATSDNPEFYVALIRSREILDQMLISTFPDPETGTPRPLLDILGIEGDTPEARRESGREALKELSSAQSDRTTKVIAVSVRATDPALAAAIANRFVVLLNTFNLERRGSQAKASRLFVEERLKEAELDLRNAEDALRVFRTRNRRFDTPELQFEDGRLQRQVQLRQDIYLGLRHEYESARIQEVNDTPLLMVIDSATPPVKRSSPARARIGVLALVFGLALAVGSALLQSIVEDLERTRNPAWVRTRATWAQVRAEARALLRRGA